MQKTACLLGVLVVGLIAACSPNSTTTSTSAAVPTTAPVSTVAAATTTTTSTTVVLDAGDGVDAGLPSGQVFATTNIERFRSKTAIILSRDEANTDLIISSSIDAAYVKTPEAIEALIVSEDRMINVIGIGDQYWFDDGQGWQLNPVAEQVLALTSVTALAPDSLDLVIPTLTDVGSEEVNGRPAVHYQGGVADVQAWLGGSPELDQFSQLNAGRIDIWVDEAGFVSKAEYTFGGLRLNSAATEYYTATFELYDFDGDFEVSPPI